MADLTGRSLEERNRLIRIREHLSVRSSIDDAGFERDVVAVCSERTESLLQNVKPTSGEHLLSHVARELGVHFEEVRVEQDIATLEKKYLEEKRELGFGQLSTQLQDPTVDALLFQRLYADGDAADRWVAILNLRETDARAYWSRAHELSHRLAEPPQRRLPFYRHRDNQNDRVESLIDQVAAELAFHKPLFAPLVASVRDQLLTWDLVNEIRRQHAATSSRLATAKAVVREWLHPAFLLEARVRGRRNHPNVDRALRVAMQDYSRSAKQADLFMYPNMRVPTSSPIWQSFQSGEPTSDFEQLGRWSTSRGSALPDIRVFTAAIPWSDRVYGLTSLYLR